MFEAEPESSVLWTYERLIDRTKPYCKLIYFDEPICLLDIMLSGAWYMSEEAVMDFDRFVWLN